MKYVLFFLLVMPFSLGVLNEFYPDETPYYDGYSYVLRGCQNELEYCYSSFEVYFERISCNSYYEDDFTDAIFPFYFHINTGEIAWGVYNEQIEDGCVSPYPGVHFNYDWPNPNWVDNDYGWFNWGDDPIFYEYPIMVDSVSIDCDSDGIYEHKFKIGKVGDPVHDYGYGFYADCSYNDLVDGANLKTIKAIVEVYLNPAYVDWIENYHTSLFKTAFYTFSGFDAVSYPYKDTGSFDEWGCYNDDWCAFEVSWDVPLTYSVSDKTAIIDTPYLDVNSSTNESEGSDPNQDYTDKFFQGEQEDNVTDNQEQEEPLPTTDNNLAKVRALNQIKENEHNKQVITDYMIEIQKFIVTIIILFYYIIQFTILFLIVFAVPKIFRSIFNFLQGGRK